MRDILLLSIVAWGLIKTFGRPHIGVYLWTWVSLMNPHRLAYGFAYSFPFAQLIAGVSLVSLFTGRQRKLSIWSREAIVIIALVAWACITTLYAVNPDGAQSELERFIKTQIFIFMTLSLMSDKKKLDGLIWVMVASIGFYGVKGGIFTITTGGNSRVWGPEGSFIGGNNEIALALLMTIPLMRYLQTQSKNALVRRGLVAAMLLCAISILGSQSRGAFLGILAIAAFFWLKSHHKLSSAILVGLIAAAGLFFMPQTWWDRMQTIQTYDQDASAMGRVNAWAVAYKRANDSLTGGGANMFTKEMFAKYAPDPTDLHDVHSIYFEMLGEQGWIGLILFLLLAFFTWSKCIALLALGRQNPENKWLADLGSMIQVSLIGYYVSGAFLGLAYFDYYYDLIAVAVVAHKLADVETAT